MKRLMLAVLLIACLVLTACNYPVSHSLEESATPGSGVISIHYAVEPEQQEAFNSAASYVLYPNGAKLYIYEEGQSAFNPLGTGHVLELDAAEALTFQYTGESAYMLQVRYSGLQEGRYELVWDCNPSLEREGQFYFTALDENGSELSYPTNLPDGSSYPQETTHFYSNDYYLGEGDTNNETTPIVFEVRGDVPAVTPSPTPPPTPTPTPTPSNTPDVTATPEPDSPVGPGVPGETMPPPPAPAAPPATGDSASPAMWICLMALCALGIVAVCRRRANG